MRIGEQVLRIPFDLLLDQLDNLRSDSLMHPERRMQTVQPQILIYRNPTRGVKRSWRRRSVFICRTLRRGILIWASLRISARILDDARKDLVCVEDKRCGVVVLLGQRFRERAEAVVPFCYGGCFEGLS